LQYSTQHTFGGYGVLAQLVERFNGIEEVSGSNPLCSTIVMVTMEVPYCSDSIYLFSMSEIFGEKLAIACAKAADETQAQEIRVLDLRGLSTITDFIIICTGNSLPHLKAVLREVSAKMFNDYEIKPTYTDGNFETKWVVLDFIDVMVHVMHEEMREFYALEELWGDAKLVNWEAA
jgi:ribosome-associated protein